MKRTNFEVKNVAIVRSENPWAYSHTVTVLSAKLATAIFTFVAPFALQFMSQVSVAQQDRATAS